MYFPSLENTDGLVELTACSDGCFTVGKNGVSCIAATGDRKLELIAQENRTLCYVKSAMGYPAYYPLHAIYSEKPLKAVIMDLDGTTVRSEEFWIWIIRRTMCSLTGNSNLDFEDEDIPHVSGHSVSEHLQYCIQKYCPGKSVEEARAIYHRYVQEEMEEIMAGRGRKGAFTPAEGVKEFLLTLKSKKIKIGLVTSGLYRKAFPEILSAFQTLDMGDPLQFYDCMITAGTPLGKETAGTLGELEAKPHPWLYAEACCVGLGIPFEERDQVCGIEDSGAGVCSVRLAGYHTIGIGGGNILSSGTQALCNYYCSQGFEQVLGVILPRMRG